MVKQNNENSEYLCNNLSLFTILILEQVCNFEKNSPSVADCNENVNT